MQLRHIEITNFRPYRAAEVDLTDADGHIHIIEGPQGAGKTSFHRAVQWGLYGGEGPTTNYKTNWNETAREEGDERMGVRIKFEEEGRDHILNREIERFTHGRQEAHEKRVLIIDGDTRREGENADEYIRDLLPEQLKDFFFLDGEMIQNLIDDDTGVEVKEDIETVLKHEAIINAREDLQSLIKDQYEPERDRIENERDERSELDDRISELREERRELRERRDELREERQEVVDNIEETREELEAYNEELIEELNAYDEEIRDLEHDKRETAEQMKEAWEDIHVGILSEPIAEAQEQLREQEEHYEELRSTLQKQDLVQRLQQQVQKEGACPICGNDHVQDVPDVSFQDEVEESEVKLTRRITDCREKDRRLADAQRPDVSPVKAANRVQELREEIRTKEQEQDELLQEYGGQPQEGQKEQFEEMLRSLNRKQEELDDEWDQVRERIQELDDEIEQKRNEKQRKDGEQAYKRIRAKIKAAEVAIDHLDTIRHEHIQQKRDNIEEEMNAVFEQVSQSEFIKGRYEGIGFRGEPGDEDSFVLELIKQGGERKAMDARPPSAGEAQLTALSFIFGLNEWAKYSTTIVFDTVAGRLDLQNSKAQGDFFTTLDEGLILLVTDAELQKLRPAIEADIGEHYRIRPDEEMNSKLEVK